MSTKDLVRRISTVTSWKVGDRVQTNRGLVGVVERVEEASGQMDGIQVVAARLEDGTVMVSIGGELDPA